MTAADRIPLTEKQLDVLRFLVEFWGDNQRFPVMQEVADRFKWSGRHGAKQHIDRIVDRGWLKSDGHGNYAVVGLDSAGPAGAYLAGLNSTQLGDGQ